MNLVLVYEYTDKVLEYINRLYSLLNKKYGLKYSSYNIHTEKTIEHILRTHEIHIVHIYASLKTILKSLFKFLIKDPAKLYVLTIREQEFQMNFLDSIYLLILGLLSKLLGKKIVWLFKSPYEPYSMGPYIELFDYLYLLGLFKPREEVKIIEILSLEPLTIVSTVYSVEAYKNLQKIIDVFKKLNISFRLIVFGKCIKIPYSLCIEDVSCIDVLRNISMVVILDRSIPSGYTLVKAHYKGRPVVASINNAYVYILPSSKLIVKTRDSRADSISSAIFSILNNIDYYKKIIAHHMPRTINDDKLAEYIYNKLLLYLHT